MSSDNSMEISTLSDNHIAAVRNFSRVYTRQIGFLRKGLQHSKYSLTEARIVFELAHRTNLTASDLCRELDLDAGYLSRILNKLEQQNLIEKNRSDEDGRQRLIKLTHEGQKAFELLDQRSNDEVSEILSKLSSGDRVNLVDAQSHNRDPPVTGSVVAEGRGSRIDRAEFDPVVTIGVKAFALSFVRPLRRPQRLMVAVL